MRPFVLVTGNPHKRTEAERALGRRLESVAVDLPEIQSLDLLAVLRAKADEAWRRVDRPLAVEETGLGLAALGGFPGPLVKWLLAAAGPEGMARAAIALDDPRAVARTAILYRDAEGDVIADAEEAGRLVLPPRGGAGFGWDPVFQPDWTSETYAELGLEEKDARGSRGRAWRRLAEELARSRS